MRRSDYQRLLDRVDSSGTDLRIHWADGPNAGRTFDWDGDLASVPGLLARALGALCFESDQGCCYAETLTGQPRLVVLGAGHVGRQVAQLGAMLGYSVVVVDPRPQFADPERLPKDACVICADFGDALNELPHYSNSYFVIVTPGHRSDQACVESCLRRPFAYVGMIGSRAKVASVRQRLLDSGITPEELKALHAPIGLPLGGREPAEIAVSICAEIIQLRAVRDGVTFDPAIRDEIRSLVTQPNRPAVLATIIGRGGSAPRGVGSRMLITPEELIGSVGGGAVENAVIQRARQLIRDAGDTALIDHDLSDAEGASLGMICGGRVRVLLEAL